MIPAQAVHHHFDEIQWVNRIRRVLDEEPESGDDDHPASISDVPRPLLRCKPEAYAPQMVALGPYHHHCEELHDMERHKLAAAKRMQSQLPGATLPHLVDCFIKLELQIRAHHHRYLNFSGETLAWMMAVDVSFLLEFLRIFATNSSKILGRVSSRMSHLVGSDRWTSAFNSLLCDALMLENQVPLFLLHQALELQCPSPQIAGQVSSFMIAGILREASPFKNLEIYPWIDTHRYSHLLDLLYHTLALGSEEELLDTIDEKKQESSNKFSRVKSFLKAALDFIASRARVHVSAVLVFLVRIPWRTIKSIPAVAIFTHQVEQLLFPNQDTNAGCNNPGPDSNAMPLLEEIAIPSVTELAKVGIKFCATGGGVCTIEFNARAATLRLQGINLDVTTEIVLRNLVAYEASIGSQPLVLSRYVELMNGVVDTPADAKLLSEAGIVMNHLKSDEEVAELWNSMTRSVRLTRVAKLEKVIEEVNVFYNGRWGVRMRRLARRCVTASWECLLLVALLLFLFVLSILLWEPNVPDRPNKETHILIKPNLPQQRQNKTKLKQSRAQKRDGPSSAQNGQKCQKPSYKTRGR